MLKRGDILKNKYEVLRQIGKGGMSTVWLVRDLILEKEWALKEINKNSVEYNAIIDIDHVLFEVEILKILDHPFAPRVVDIYENSESICIVMDFVQGESLQRILTRDGLQDQELVVMWMTDICRLLEYLHKNNIIYRDMKPGNIILTRGGTVKVIDYGIAKIVKDGRYWDRVALGTAGYASPEHRQKMTDERSDIYTVGMTMYHLLTGDSPTRRGFHQVPIRKINPDLSSGLEQIIIKCTMPDSNDRYQNMQQLIDALENYRKLDVSYIDKLGRRIKTSKLLREIAVLTIAAGFLIFEAGYMLDKKAYDGYLNTSYVAADQTLEDNYLKAVNIMPYKEDAYLSLVDLYQRSGFTKENMAHVSDLYKNYQKYIQYIPYFIRSDKYEELNYSIGYSYVTSCSEIENISVSERLIEAGDYFRRAYEDDNHAIGSRAGYAMAYSSLALFYQNYYGQPGIDSEVSGLMSSSLTSIMQSTTSNIGKGATKTNLATYNIVLEFLIDNGKAMKDAGTSSKTINGFIDQIASAAESVSPADDTEKRLIELVENNIETSRNAVK